MAAKCPRIERTTVNTKTVAKKTRVPDETLVTTQFEYPSAVISSIASTPEAFPPCEFKKLLEQLDPTHSPIFDNSREPVPRPL
jgi:hypothetical protein